MRKLTPLLVSALVAVLPTLAATAPADAKPAKPRAELVAKGVTGTFSAGKVAASATVKNKGNLKAGPSQTTFRLSTDGTASGDDPVIGTVDTGKVKPKKSKKVSGDFAVPASVVPGSYRVIACADSGLKVKERKEANNCKAARGSLTVTVSPNTLVPVSATAGTGGTVAASGVTGGTCTGTSCTFPGGVGKVTFTPSANVGYRFGSWTGATCTGYTTGADNAITFTNPNTARACTATFVQQVTIAWSVTGGVVPPIEGSVTATVTGGSCTANGATGSCTVDSGASTVTLTASAGLPPVLTFSAWGAAPAATCAGVVSGTSSEIMTFTNPTAAQDCVAAYTLII